jgi:hypothetical protein
MSAAVVSLLALRLAAPEAVMEKGGREAMR